MEINKQLFEDVLSGKLKGTFVLKNEKRLSDNLLTDIYKSTVVLGKTTFYFNGKPIVSDYSGILDIIDFIPDIDMKENELTIEIPDGKIVDWEESKKQNKIVLIDEQLTYEDICKKLMETEYYYINSVGWIHKDGGNLGCTNNNAAASEHQLECILAKNKLANVAKYLNGGWKPEKSNSYTYVINNYQGNLGTHVVYTYKEEYSVRNGQVIFKTEELAHQAIKILGEKTVKLALEPLGI